jgi:tetratricopeptide (TPR) repeat protein
MERLVGIVKILRKGEKRLLRHLYSASTNGEDRLRLELFNLIDSGKFKTEEDAVKAMNRNHSRSAHSHLKSRLRDDILNVLLLQESAKRIANANHAAAFECRRKLTQSYVLIARGAFKEGVEILKTAKSQAIKFELVAEHILIDQLVRGLVHLIKDVKQLHELNSIINKNMEVWADILRAEEISLALTLPHLYKETEELSDGILKAERIEELRELYSNSGSARVGFWYYIAFIEYANRNRMYNEAVEAGKLFIEMVKDNPSVWSKNNVAGANQILGTAYLHTRDYHNAASHFEVADKNFPVAGNNRLANMETLIRSQIGMGDFAAALRTVEAAQAHPRIKGRAVTLPRWFYFQACVQLKMGDADASFRILNQEGYLTKQQDEWNVWFRIVEMMAMVEQRDEEWIDFKLQTLRKFIARYRKLGTPRVKAAVELLSAILRKGLVFDNLGKKAEEGLKLSLAEAEGYEWSPEGAEVIRFDHWVQSKRKKKVQDEVE